MDKILKKPFDLVLFGGTGDLSLRKLLPSMYRTFIEGEIPEGSRILVCSRKQEYFDDNDNIIENAFKKFMPEDEYNEDSFKQFLKFVQPALVDVANYDNGWEKFKTIFEGREDVSRIFYLAIIPSIYGVCCQNLGRSNLVTEDSRIVVEKPIGYDQDSAEEINEQIAKYFAEDQIYRIDHYLGKETVQNLIALRFSNSLFEQFWDAKSIDHIQISINEQVGLEGRAGFYDGAGAVRDMVQNHLLQLLGLIAMESPNKMGANNIRNEKIKVLQALRPITEDNVQKYAIRGQYTTGTIDEKEQASYLEELGSNESQTETYVAIKANIDNWRWANVPFYIRTGKCLKRRSAEIVIQFKDVSHNAFDSDAGSLIPNRLIIQLQPQERMQLLLMAKDMTQLKTVLKPVKLDLNFTESSKGFKSFGYKRLLLDAISGNASLFIHRDEGSAAWAWVDPILNYWKDNKVAPFLYPAGTWGPEQADQLLRNDGREWFDIEK